MQEAIPDLLIVFQEGVHVSGLTTTAADGRRIEIDGVEWAPDVPAGLHSRWGLWLAGGPGLAGTETAGTRCTRLRRAEHS